MDRASLRRPVNCLLVSSLVLLIATSSALITDEKEGAKFLQDLDPVYLKEGNTQIKARWQYITDITDEHSQAQVRKLIFFCLRIMSTTVRQHENLLTLSGSQLQLSRVSHRNLK